MDFWDKAEECIEKFDYDGAVKIYKNALKTNSNNPEILDALGDVLLLMGDVQQAKQVLSISLRLSPNAGASKYLNMGQITEGKESLKFYAKGIELLKSEMTKQDPETRKISTEKLISGYCAMAEIYMTDECYDDNAESECERLLTESLKIDSQNIEALQLMASFKISQQHPEQAIEFLNRSCQLWSKKLDPSELPPYEFRVQTAKLFIELEKYESAADVLDALLMEFDEISELWYLLGYCQSFYEPESAIDPLNTARELLVKENCQVPEIFGQVDACIKKVQEAIAKMPHNNIGGDEDGDDDGDGGDDGNDMDTS
eukprot:TRINITY_DN8205_c0_g1_i1.p1 TRINITY_DN8205_c0_g1~~TRINITY_DN8205_c0_g1_i1.p1  ORF type:complete len:326 (-),score=79.94 TRINITY_DN8205_c0_g1_i1:45-989(-)